MDYMTQLTKVSKPGNKGQLRVTVPRSVLADFPTDNGNVYFEWTVNSKNKKKIKIEVIVR